MDNAGYRGAHHLQGIEGGALRHQGYPPGAQGKATPPSRGQLVRDRGADPPDLKIPYDDVRAEEAISPHRHVRHQYPHPLHPQHGQRLG